MRIIILSLFIGIFSIAHAQKDAPRIAIDSDGHSGKILSLLYSPTGDTLITASEDKTIRMWNVKTGEMIKRLQAQVGDGYQGMYYAAALSPDGNYLAAAGYPAFSETNYILIVDIKNNKQIARLNAHTDVINSLVFSSDGEFLISGSDDGTINIFNTADKTKIAKSTTITLNTRISDLSFNNRTYSLAIASDQEEILLYDLMKLKAGNKAMSPRHLKYHKDFIHRVQFSPDGRYLASSSMAGDLVLWQSDGTFLKEIVKDENIKNAIAFSYSGDILVGMDIFGKGESYSIPEGRLLSTYSGHDNTVFCATFSPQSSQGNYAVTTAGGNDNVINFWNPVNGKTVSSISGKGSTIWKLDFDDNNNLLIGREYKDGGKYAQLFNLRNFSLSQIDKKYNSAESRDIQQTDLYTVKAGKNTLTNNEFEDGKVLSYAMREDGIAAVGSDFTLKLYKENGQPLKELIGHTGGVRSVAFSPDGKYLISGSEDQTIKIWNLAEEGDFPSLIEKVNAEDWLQYFEAVGVAEMAAEKSTEGWQKVITTLKENKDKTYKDIEYLFENTASQLKPFATLFISTNDEWICWTSAGYFNSSSAGGEYFGWHVNRGPDKLADFYMADQYFDLLYRPEIMKESISSGNRVEEVLRSKGEKVLDVAKLNRPSAAFFSMNSSSASKYEDFIYKEGKYITEKTDINLDVEVFDGGGGIREVNIYHNGKLVINDQEIKNIGEGNSFTKTYPVELLNGVNEFTVTVLNYQRIESRADPLKIEYTGEVTATSNLFILAVGINEYKNSKYNLNYAVADAKSFVDKLESLGNKIFKNVRSVEIYNTDATKERIAEAFKSMENMARPEDVFVFYYAGHGTIDEDNADKYYFVPTDVTKLYGDPEQLEEKAISAEELRSYLVHVKPQKQLILMDACHSGGAISSIRTRAGSSEEKAIVQLARASGVVMVASSGTKQFASEIDVLKHGVFTYALLEALDGEADNGDNKVTVAELKSYMEERVPELSAEYGGTAQYPTGFTHGNDFPIAFLLDGAKLEAKDTADGKED